MTNTFYFDYQVSEKEKSDVRVKELENHIMNMDDKPKANLYQQFGKKVDYSFYQFLWMKTKEMLQTFADLFGLSWQIEDKNEKMRIYRMAEQKIEQDLDITHILKRLYDVDKLKLLLLDEDQIQLFNTLAKPVIKIHKKRSIRISRMSTMNAQMMRFSQFFQSSATIQDAKTLFRIYSSIKDNRNKNIEMNQKILQLVKEHDLVQTILNKEELVEKIRMKIFQKTQKTDSDDSKSQQAQSELNDDCLKERVDQVKQDLTKRSIRSLSVIDNIPSHKTIGMPSLQFKSHVQFKEEQNVLDRKIKRLQTQFQFKNQFKEQYDVNPIYSQKNIEQPNQKENGFKIKKTFMQTSTDEFSIHKSFNQPHKKPNKLKLWTQSQNPFAISKDQISQYSNQEAIPKQKKIKQNHQKYVKEKQKSFDNKEDTYIKEESYIQENYSDIEGIPIDERNLDNTQERNSENTQEIKQSIIDYESYTSIFKQLKEHNNNQIKNSQNNYNSSNFIKNSITKGQKSIVNKSPNHSMSVFGINDSSITLKKDEIQKQEIYYDTKLMTRDFTNSSFSEFKK